MNEIRTNDKPPTPGRNCSPNHSFTYGHCDESTVQSPICFKRTSHDKW